jgi:regulator of nucleoside diphosphate kinase
MEDFMDRKAAARPLTERRPPLIIDVDLYHRLRALAEHGRDLAPEVADKLLDEIERADLRRAEDIPDNVVTIGSTVTFRDGARTQSVEIVMPPDADVDHGRVSVLTPVGAALLGLATGQSIRWELGYGRVRTIEVIDVKH